MLFPQIMTYFFNVYAHVIHQIKETTELKYMHLFENKNSKV